MEGSNTFLHLLIGPLMLVISLILFYFQPKKINPIYGHRTSMSMKNQNTWKEANKRSTHMMILVSALTCLLQVVGIVFNINLYTINTCVYCLNHILSMPREHTHLERERERVPS